MEQTLLNLIEILDPDNLESLVEDVFIGSEVEPAPIIEALVARCIHEPLEVTNRISLALFSASEIAYYRQHRSLYDEAFYQIGRSGIFMLSLATPPFPTGKPIEALRGVVGEDNLNLKTISDLAAQFTPRRWGEHFETEFLRGVVENIPSTALADDISQIGSLLAWCRLAGLDRSQLVQFLATHDWRQQLYQADLAPTTELLVALHEHARESYEHLLASDKDALIGYFKLLTDTLTVEELDGDVSIEFIVDETRGVQSAHEQALERLRNLRKFFPDYQHYRSRGLYPAMHGLQPPHDETRKAIPNETLEAYADAERNQAHFQAVKSHYCAPSIYEWQDQWYALRTELLEFLEKAIDLYVNLSRHRLPDVDSLNSALRHSLLQELHLKDLPISLADLFGEEQKAVDQWIRDVSFFLRQFGEHDPISATAQSSRQMRSNLRDAIKKMPSAHQAFGRLISETQAYFDLLSLDNREKDTYQYLADVLDFWYERPTGEATDLRRAVEVQRRVKRENFTQAVRSTMASLEERGIEFTYPTGPLLDHPLVGLCLAFEVLDFETVLEQLLVIIAQSASFPLHCDFIYLLPLLNGHRYLPAVWRISSRHAYEIAQQTLGDQEWALLPIEPPEALFDILPDIPEAAIDELEMSSEFYRIYSVLNTVRNKIHTVQCRLDPDSAFEAALGERYRHSLQTEVDRATEAIAVLKDSMLQFATTNPAKKEWLEFFRCCSDRMEKSVDFELTDPEAYEPIGVWQDMEPQILFGRYLNARYLHNTM